MADGVENAAVVCCFMTPKYQNSRNCEKELLYAERRRVSIIPCRLSRDWEPSTWLGLLIAGLVWIDFREITEANIDLKIDRLIEQIRIVAGSSLRCFLPGLHSTVPCSCATDFGFVETLSMLPMRPINAQSQLYPVLPASSEKSSLTCATPDSPKRMTAAVSGQHQSADKTHVPPSTTSPPAVPPRPDRALVQERLLHADLKNKSNSIDHGSTEESIDGKKENRLVELSSSLNIRSS